MIPNVSPLLSLLLLNLELEITVEPIRIAKVNQLENYPCGVSLPAS